MNNIDHLTAYIIVFNRFKKVTVAGSVSDTEVNNLYQFYKRLENEGFEIVKSQLSKAQFSKRVASLIECGFSRIFLQNLHVKSKNNVIPFIKLLEIKFDQQVPDNFIEPVSTFNQRDLRIA